MALFRIAELLHCPVYVLSEMPVSEFQEWLAYFKIQSEKT